MVSNSLKLSNSLSQPTVLLSSEVCSRVRLFATPQTIQSLKFSRPHTGEGCHSLLQEIFPTQGSNPGLPHCRRILYQLSYKGSPRILEWAAYPFSSRSSQPWNGTGVSYIAGRFYTGYQGSQYNSNSLYLLIPILPIFPSSTPLPLGNHKSVLCIWVRPCFIDVFICVIL